MGKKEHEEPVAKKIRTRFPALLGRNLLLLFSGFLQSPKGLTKGTYKLNRETLPLTGGRGLIEKDDRDRAKKNTTHGVDRSL